MPKPLRAEIHISLIEDQVLGAFSLQIDSSAGHNEPQRINTTIGVGQLFLRMQEHCNNVLRSTATQMENQIKQRKQQQ